jgi:hypothetical protein
MLKNYAGEGEFKTQPWTPNTHKLFSSSEDL